MTRRDTPLDEDHARQLGEHLLTRRTELGLTTRQAAELAGMEQPTYVRIEKGQFKKPGLDKLTGIAEALDIQLSVLYELADYPVPTNLPNFTQYLRANYGFPEDAIDKIYAFATKLANEHGINLNGPAPGEIEI